MRRVQYPYVQDVDSDRGDSDMLVVTRDVSVCAPRVIACGAVVARPRLLLVAVFR